MAERPIVLYGDPVLREKAIKVEEFNQELKDLVSDMEGALKKAQGLGLAAPQVGVAKRVFILDLSAIDLSEQMRVFVNPEIVETSGEIELEEGCLSFPGIYQSIIRSENVLVRASDLDGNQFEMKVTGMTARAVLHEYDHLEGILFIDLLSPLTRTMLKGRLKKLVEAE